MTRLVTLAAAAALLSSSCSVWAGDQEIMVMDAYARASSPVAKAGAAFMQIKNMTAEDDRLIAATSSVSKLTQLHTHKDAGDGVMKMLHVEEGFALAAGDTLMLARGGKHVMLMGLNEPPENGDVISVTLTFEKAGDIVLEVPVDLDRKPAAGAHGHGAGEGSGHGSGSGSHSN